MSAPRWPDHRGVWLEAVAAVDYLTDTLTAAITAGEPWLRAALCVVADGHTTSLDIGAVSSLEALATARDHSNIPPAAPLDACAWLPHDHLYVIGDDATPTSVTDGISL